MESNFIPIPFPTFTYGKRITCFVPVLKISPKHRKTIITDTFSHEHMCNSVKIDTEFFLWVLEQLFCRLLVIRYQFDSRDDCYNLDVFHFSKSINHRNRTSLVSGGISRYKDVVQTYIYIKNLMTLFQIYAGSIFAVFPWLHRNISYIARKLL